MFTPDWIIAIENSALSLAINESLWLFAVIQVFHLFGLVLLGGALLAVDFSVLGIGFPKNKIRELDQQARKWLWVGMVLIVVSGVLMFLSEAEKAYFNPAFRFKMIAFVLAALLLATVRKQFLHRPENDAGEIGTTLKLIAILSIVLWLAVGLGGRAIGYY